jgi:Retrotransposon gag protein
MVPPRTRNTAPVSEDDGTDSPPSPNSTQTLLGNPQPPSDLLMDLLTRLTDAVTISPRNGTTDSRPPPSTKGPDVRPPDRFSGEDSTLLKPFLAQCRMNFLANPSRFTDEPSKVVFAGSYLSSVAQAWFEPFVFAEEGTAAGLFQNFAGFEEELTRMFGDPNEVASAERKLRSLRMAEHHHTPRYVTDFRCYSAITAWNNAALVSQFRSGLPDRILDELARRDDPITDLAELQHVVLRLDTRYWERRDERARQERTNRTFSPGSPALRDRPTGNTFATNPRPAFTHSRPPTTNPRSFSSGHRQGRLMEEERMRRLCAGLCLCCEEAGHRTDACPRCDRMDGHPPGRTPGRFGSVQDTTSAPADATLLELGTETAGDNTEHADGDAWMAKNDSTTQ